MKKPSTLILKFRLPTHYHCLSCRFLNSINVSLSGVQGPKTPGPVLKYLLKPQKDRFPTQHSTGTQDISDLTLWKKAD